MTDRHQDERRHPLETLLDEAIGADDGDGKLTIDDLLEAFGKRSFGPLIAALALIVITPIGGIPGVPTLFGVVFILIAVQLLFGRENPWLPGFIRKIGFDRDKAKSFRDRFGEWLERIDTLIGPRLEWAAGPVAQWIAALMIVALAAAMPPLEAIPFAVLLPAFAILLFGLALTAKDGLLMLIASTVTLATAWMGWTWLAGG